MKKIIIDEMELLVENYNRDYIKSDITGKNLVRIKCETTLKNEDNDKLKKLLDKESFELRIPDEKFDFRARKGEITYSYTHGNPFKDENIEYTHVLEIIEYEENKEIEPDKRASLELELARVKKRLSIIERALLTKGIISKDILEEIMTDKLNRNSI